MMDLGEFLSPSKEEWIDALGVDPKPIGDEESIYQVKVSIDVGEVFDIIVDVPGNSEKNSPQIIEEKLGPVLAQPRQTFDTVLGQDPVKGFIGEVDGHDVAAFVYKQGPRKGKLASSVIPTPNQYAKWGVKPK